MWERAARWSTQLRRECWVATGLSRWNRCSDPQGSGRGRESINQVKWNSARVVVTLSHLASSTNVCSVCRMRMSHPIQPSYRWNGEAESSWGRVFWTPRFRTSSTTRSEPLSLTRCRCSCKTKEHQQRHRKNKSHTHTQREKSSSVKITGIWTRGKIKFAVKRGPRANLECEASTPFIKLNRRRLGCLYNVFWM